METIQAAKPRTRRFFGKAALGAALAAFFGGRLASPSSAASRKMAVAQANAFIDDCVDQGGDPDVQIDEEGGNVTATCSFGPDIEVDSCTYWYDDPTPFCFSDLRKRPGLDHVFGGVTHDLTAARSASSGSGVRAKGRKRGRRASDGRASGRRSR